MKFDNGSIARIILVSAQITSAPAQLIKLCFLFLVVASSVINQATVFSLPFSLYYYKRHWYEIYWSNSSMVCQPKNPVGVNATLKLTLERGLVLQDTDGTIAWLTNISGKSVPSLNLTNMGNLMLLDENNATMWQSFDHRTKTLVVVQKLMAGQNLTMKQRIVFALSHP